MIGAIGDLWTEGDIGESSVVNSHGYALFAAAPIGTRIERQSKPAVEIIGGAGASTAGIPFEATAQREHGAGKLAVDVRARIPDGVSAEKLPLGGGLVLRRGEARKQKQKRKCGRQ